MVWSDKRCTFEGLAEGQDATPATTATGSATPLTAAVGSGTAVGETTSPIYGTVSCLIDGTTGNARWLELNPDAATPALAVQVDVRLPLTTDTDMQPLMLRSDAASVARIQVRTTGLVEVRDRNATLLHTTAAPPAGDYTLTLAAQKGTTTSNGKVRYWLRDRATGTLVDSYSSDAVDVGTADLTNTRAGKTSSTGATTLLVDNLAIRSGLEEIDAYAGIDPPTVDAGPDTVSVEPGGMLTLVAESSEAAVVWSQVAGPPAGLTQTGDLTAEVVPQLSLTVQELVFAAEATNTLGSITSEITVTVYPHNEWVATTAALSAALIFTPDL